MHKQTIALIDDDRNILTSLSIALEKEGFKVQTYIDGESALIGLTRTPPDLAVVDIKMPKMDGEELLKKLRKKTSLPVIFLTSKDDEIDELLGLKLGADDFVKKSILLLSSESINYLSNETLWIKLIFFKSQLYFFAVTRDEFSVENIIPNRERQTKINTILVICRQCFYMMPYMHLRRIKHVL